MIFCVMSKTLGHHQELDTRFPRASAHSDLLVARVRSQWSHPNSPSDFFDPDAAQKIRALGMPPLNGGVPVCTRCSLCARSETGLETRGRDTRQEA